MIQTLKRHKDPSCSHLYLLVTKPGETVITKSIRLIPEGNCPLVPRVGVHEVTKKYLSCSKEGYIPIGFAVSISKSLMKQLEYRKYLWFAEQEGYYNTWVDHGGLFKFKLPILVICPDGTGNWYTQKKYADGAYSRDCVYKGYGFIGFIPYKMETI